NRRELEGRQIAMRIKTVKILLTLALFALGVILSFRLGVNSRTKTDTTITIDLLTQIHQRIESGNAIGAKNLTEIGLLGNMDEYDRLRRDILAKIVYGTNVTDI